MTTHPHPQPSRRGFFGAAFAATGLLAVAPSHALRVETFSLPTAMAPDREDAISWDLLLSGQFVIPTELAELDGRPVSLAGFPLQSDAVPDILFLTPYLAHCPSCIPGGAAALVAMQIPKGVSAEPGHVLAMAGTFRLFDRNTGLLYGLDHISPL